MEYISIKNVMNEAGKVTYQSGGFHKLKMKTVVSVTTRLMDVRGKYADVDVNLFTTGVLVTVGDIDDSINSHFTFAGMDMKIACGYLMIAEDDRTIIIDLGGTIHD